MNEDLRPEISCAEFHRLVALQQEGFARVDQSLAAAILKRAKSRKRPAEQLKRLIEDSLVAKLDVCGRVMLLHVRGFADVAWFVNALREFIETDLPKLQHEYLDCILPGGELESTRQFLIERFGTSDGFLIGTIPVERQAERLFYWRAEAFKRIAWRYELEAETVTEQRAN